MRTSGGGSDPDACGQGGGAKIKKFTICCGRLKWMTPDPPPPPKCVHTLWTALKVPTPRHRWNQHTEFCRYNGALWLMQFFSLYSAGGTPPPARGTAPLEPLGNGPGSGYDSRRWPIAIPKVLIPKGRYSEGRYFERSLFRKVVIPKVAIPKDRYSERSLFRKSLYRKITIRSMLSNLTKRRLGRNNIDWAPLNHQDPIPDTGCSLVSNLRGNSLDYYRELVIVWNIMVITLHGFCFKLK